MNVSGRDKQGDAYFKECDTAFSRVRRSLAVKTFALVRSSTLVVDLHPIAWYFSVSTNTGCGWWIWNT